MLEIELRHSSVKQIVSLEQVTKWLNGASTSPRESIK